MATLYLKNLAGDLIQVLHDPKEETLWDLRRKLQKILNLDDPWRIQFLDNIENIENIDNIINYIVIDEAIIDVKIMYDKRVLDPITDYYYDHYTISVSIDDDNYDYIFYYNDYGDFFLSPYEREGTSFDVRVFQHIIVEVQYDLCTSYPDLKTLLLETKIIPILYREKIAHMANNKWLKII